MSNLSLHDIPGSEHHISGYVPAVANGTDDIVAIGVAPFDCTVIEVVVMHDTVITGVATNNFVGSLFNGGSDGTGVVSVAAKTYTNGTDGAQFTDTLTLSSTAANLNLSAGDRILYDKTENGTGLTDPAKMVVVKFKAR